MIFTVTGKDGKPVDTARATGFANFSSGKLKGRATLWPNGANRLMGHGLMSARPDLEIQAEITLPDGIELKAAFKPRQLP